jgi:hypothetical protein
VFLKVSIHFRLAILNLEVILPILEHLSNVKIFWIVITWVEGS